MTEYNRTLLDSIVCNNSEKLKQYKYNSLSDFEKQGFPIWKRIQFDGNNFPAYKRFNNLSINYEKQDGLDVCELNSISGFIDIAKRDYTPSFGISKKHVLLSEVFNNTGAYINVSKNIKVTTPVHIKYKFDDTNSVVIDHNIIIADAGSEITVVIEYTDDCISHECYHNGLTKIIAQDNAKVTLIKVQNMSNNSIHLDSCVSVINDYSNLSYKAIDIGAQTTATDYTSYIYGDSGNSDVETIYFGDGSRKLDMGYNIFHFGRRSFSNIDSHGALKDNSKKVFRGNLNFMKGSKLSQGAEQEFTILLDKNVRADSIPALFCNEDDVKGDHAASAGQISDEQLFYLMSRGLTEKEAKKLIISASFSPVIEKIPIQSITEKLNQELNRRL